VLSTSTNSRKIHAVYNLMNQQDNFLVCWCLLHKLYVSFSMSFLQDNRDIQTIKPHTFYQQGQSCCQPAWWSRHFLALCAPPLPSVSCWEMTACLQIQFQFHTNISAAPCNPLLYFHLLKKCQTFPVYIITLFWMGGASTSGFLREGHLRVSAW
jgi:hypothetical protein